MNAIKAMLVFSSMACMQRLATLLLLLTLVWVSPVLRAETALDPESLPFDAEPNYYGLYFQQSKMGWMSVQLVRTGPNEAVQSNETFLEMSMGGGMGTMKSRERRVYALPGGELKSLSFDMEGKTGSTRIDAERKGDKLDVRVMSGGQSRQEDQDAPKENLYEMLAAERSLRAGSLKEGQSFRFVTFDPSILAAATTVMNVETRETREVDGQTVKTWRLAGLIQELAMPVISWYDEKGKLVESLLGGFMRIRAEKESVARSEREKADIVQLAVVKPPSPPGDTKSAVRLKAVFEGVPEELLLDTSRQEWSKRPDGSRALIVSREMIDFSRTPNISEINRTNFAETLKAEMHLQSDDPAIIAVARKMSTSNSGETAKRLMNWVYESVDKTYVPAFSNASEVLRSMKGDCGEHAVLFVALARAAGIPAREVAGLVYAAEAGGFAYHAWAEVWLGRWVAVDPAWGQLPADVGHIAFASGGLGAQAKIAALIGRVSIREASLDNR